MEHFDVTGRPWFAILPPRQQELQRLSMFLYNREATADYQLSDYSFILFPMSKAYEGFLKLYLLEMNLITRKVFEGNRFRIGRALNPDVRKEQRDKYWLYDDVQRVCGDKTARDLWQTWLQCRNQVFHYFPMKPTKMTLPVVYERLQQIDDSISAAFSCQQKSITQV